jgi:hypothetical protein
MVRWRELNTFGSILLDCLQRVTIIALRALYRHGPLDLGLHLLFVAINTTPNQRLILLGLFIRQVKIRPGIGRFSRCMAGKAILDGFTDGVIVSFVTVGQWRFDPRFGRIQLGVDDLPRKPEHG